MGARMQQRATGARPGRRRFLIGVAAIGGVSALAACQNRLLSSPSSATSASRKPTPLPAVDPPVAPGVQLDVEFGRVVTLEGVSIEQDVVRPGEYLRVWIHWLAVAASQADLRSLGELVGPQGRVIGKEDDQIGRRKHLLSRWQPGERQVDEMRIRVAPSTQPGEYALTMAVLRPDNQTHVPITSRPAQTALWNEDTVLVGTIEVP